MWCEDIADKPILGLSFDDDRHLRHGTRRGLPPNRFFSQISPTE